MAFVIVYMSLVVYVQVIVGHVKILVEMEPVICQSNHVIHVRKIVEHALKS